MIKQNQDIKKIVSNRIRILNYIDGQHNTVNRKYRHKDQNTLIDPIRQIKLRCTFKDLTVVASASDQYNLKALQLSFRNDIVNAIDQLHKGLTINPNNLNCRFTHGVLMFKLGLFSQAKHDFKILLDLYPKELNVYFNYALVLLQQQEYDTAIQVIKNLHQKSKASNDFNLIYDAYLIEAQCNWRKNEPLEVINCLQNAQKLKQKLQKSFQSQQNQEKNLEKELLSWEIRLMKNDIQEDQIKSLENQSNSARVKSSYEFVQEYKKTVQNDKSDDKQSQISKRLKLKISKSPETIQKSKNQVFIKENEQPNSQVNQQMIDIVEHFSNNNHQLTFRRQSNQQQNMFNSKEIMKQFITEHQKGKEIAMNKKFNKNVGDFYQQLRNNSNKHIDSNTQIRFDKVFAYMLQSQNNIGQNHDFYLLFGDQLNDMTAEEFKMVLKYHNSLKYTHENQNEKTDQIKDGKIDAFSKFLMEQDEKNATVKVRKLEGLDFNPNGVVEINKDQDILEDIMDQLNQKLKHVNNLIDSEIEKEDNKIFNIQLKNIDLTEYRAVQLTNNINKVQIENKVISKLKKGLQSDNFVPYNVLNVLKADIEQRQKMREIVEETQTQKIKRIEQRKVIMIRREFQLFHGSERNLQIIDLLLNRLKFFSNLDINQRIQVYKKCDFLTLPPRTTIFNQGDLGDQMYIIVKGRVTVEQANKNTGYMPIVIAYLIDGVHFGELSLLDNQKIDLNTKKSIFVNDKEKQKLQTRAASCVTTEETDLIVLDHKLAAAIYQNKPNNENNLIDDLNNNKEDSDYLIRKVRALQEIPYFQNVEPRSLKNIAANLTVKTYSLGQFIVKSGEIPEGLFIILKGQCRVVAQRISKRNLEMGQGASNKSQSLKRDYHKLKIIDRAIFNFDPKTSVINQNLTSGANFQNEIIYIDKMGKEMKDRREFVDYLTFNRMTTGNYFSARVLVPYDYYASQKRIYYGDHENQVYQNVSKSLQQSKNEEFENIKSLLSVIADSSSVEVWVVDKKMMGYLSENELVRVYERIILDKDADRPYHQQEIDYLISQFVQFNQYSIQIAESFLYQREINKIMKQYRQ